METECQGSQQEHAFQTRLVPHKKTQPPDFFAEQFRLLWGETKRANSEPFSSFHDQSGAVQADSFRISTLVQKHLFCFLSRWVVVSCSKPNCASEDSLNKTWVLFLSPSRSNWSTLADPSLLSQFTNTFVSYLDTIPVQFLYWPEKRVEKSPNTFGLVCTLFLVTTRAFSDRFQF